VHVTADFVLVDHGPAECPYITGHAISDIAYAMLKIVWWLIDLNIGHFSASGLVCSCFMEDPAPQLEFTAL
jgi:hypothetical protein